ncbi:uncharacterized protein LOC123699450 [Colias croceus]|uniref:uncharacterized protein LOC123699450 n=1 Tax=Colias crocea TaxID=72248 RepID=UPI001E27E1A7|nr:uncharacterized protein LOC123699450 [Colias croceus]
MGSIRVLVCYFLFTFLVTYSLGYFIPSSDSGFSAVKKAPRWNVPWMGIGMWCNGCPPRGCEDDEAVIHGFCCGCAHILDQLPILCPEFLQCPLNLHGLCHDYEYMMRCCC